MDFKKIFGSKNWLVGLAVALFVLLFGGIAFWLGGHSHLPGTGFIAQDQGKLSEMRNDNRFPGGGDKRENERPRNSQGNSFEMNGRKDGQGNDLPNAQAGNNLGMGLGRTIEGKIVSIDGNSVTIETENGTKTFTFSEDTTVEKISTVSSGDLSTDSQVVIVLDGPINADSLSAQKIQIKN